VDDLVDVAAVQDEARQAPRAERKAERGRERRADEQAEDQRPDGWHDIAEHHRQRALHDRAGDVVDRPLAELDVALHHEQRRRLQAGEQEDAADREQDRLELAAVDTRQRMSEREHHHGQQGSAGKLKGPCGVEKGLIRFALGADNALPDADVAEQLGAGSQHVDDQHETEDLGGQQARLDHVGAEAQDKNEGKRCDHPACLQAQPAVGRHPRQRQPRKSASAVVHAQAQLRDRAAKPLGHL
jgi:hypothetical protein